MKIFLDSVDISAIRDLLDFGIVDGITTNPSLIAKSGLNYNDVLSTICKMIDGPVNAEVIATDFKTMLLEARKLQAISKNIVIKLPITSDGLKASKYLVNNGYKVNITLCFTVSQALLAAKTGATYVSPFVGRLEDTGVDGLGLLNNIMTVYENYDIKTQIIAASIRNVYHVTELAGIGVDIVTIPPKIAHAMVQHPLTTSGLDGFLHDWHNAGNKNILSS
ncbi:putative transaldolase [Candidatus Xenohaliotis californiensis]|uniref:Transaldolase n=1 Tax=Candidatus Xenohaliotis californiensis TaxID=84677 RepID=A0ABP0ETP5_9RICK|nr:putative transaldolase [Candidatus Xenohaliotis californiensis]